MKVFYHNDLDGRCSGHVVAEHFDNREERDFIEINYGMEFPFELIDEGEPVFILDYSIELSEMEELLKITKSVFWIDHHKTAITKYKDFPEKIDGIRSMLTSGCVLTYMFLNNLNPENYDDYFKVPMYIRYVGDRDMYKFRYDPETTAFCSGADSLDAHPLSADWEFMRTKPMGVISLGGTINNYKKQSNLEYIKNFMFQTEFEGYNALVCNIGRAGLELFDEAPEADIYITYVYDGEKFNVSLRSKKVNVSTIALKYGGGGHRLASGFSCLKLPFK